MISSQITCFKHLSNKLSLLFKMKYQILGRPIYLQAKSLSSTVLWLIWQQRKSWKLRAGVVADMATEEELETESCEGLEGIKLEGTTINTHIDYTYTNTKLRDLKNSEA
ncbi:unnamed protein product [Lupinus luteus]|uniref:Uncharacterized protein n=1 Tax=Lupinus luteus TaxID=3873 RepID=A0AAV1Y333_LUPLU